MKVATVCRDEGAGEVCMRGTVATKAIRVRMCALRTVSRSASMHRAVKNMWEC
jgi:hypothetical protein